MSKITNYGLNRSGTGCFTAGNSGRQRVKICKDTMVTRDILTIIYNEGLLCCVPFNNVCAKHQKRAGILAAPPSG